MNPFTGRSMPIESVDKLLFREKYMDILSERIESRKQTTLLGVEGCGKTSLMKAFFCREYRIKMAERRILISPLTEFPTDLSGEDSYHHITDMMVSSLRILSQCGKKEEMDDLLSQCESIRESVPIASSRLSATVDLIHNIYGYNLVMLIDNFEHFTSSPEVTMSHHELMKSLVESEYFQFIVVTNYDLNQDSLPSHVAGSHFISRFADNEVRLDGWTVEETKFVLMMRLENNPIQFSEQLIEEKIYPVTGGIPDLVFLAARYAYDYIEEHGTEEGMTFRQTLYCDSKVQKFFEHWCAILSAEQVKALRELANATMNESLADRSRSVSLRTLARRGLLVHHTDGSFEFNCRLFKSYCLDGDKLEKAAEKNPLLKDGLDQGNSMIEGEVDTATLLMQLKNQIATGGLSKENFIAGMNEILQLIPDVTRMVDMNEELSDDILRMYQIDIDAYHHFEPSVQKFIYMGIQFDRSFENVMRPGLDYSSVYLSFTKAVEAHLNLTLVPVLKKVLPDYEIILDTKPVQLGSLEPGRTLPLGTIRYIMRRNAGLSLSGKDALVRFCVQNGYHNMPENWWESLVQVINQLPDLRNKCPHCSILEDQEGKFFLQLLFGSKNGDPSKNFMAKCTKIYQSLMV